MIITTGINTNVHKNLDFNPRMDPTARFFSKLRKLAVTLETETTKLQENFEKRNNDDEDDDDSGE